MTHCTWLAVSALGLTSVPKDVRWLTWGGREEREERGEEEEEGGTLRFHHPPHSHKPSVLILSQKPELLSQLPADSCHLELLCLPRSTTFLIAPPAAVEPASSSFLAPPEPFCCCWGTRWVGLRVREGIVTLTHNHEQLAPQPSASLVNAAGAPSRPAVQPPTPTRPQSTPPAPPHSSSPFLGVRWLIQTRAPAPASQHEKERRTHTHTRARTHKTARRHFGMG